MNLEADQPKYLYHYTSIYSLACILESAKIRFTKLSNLNDPLEGKSADLKGSEHLVFCSSWTAHKRDTIPLWKMYTDLEGVRIKAPINMFNTNAEVERGKWGKAEVNFSTLKNKIETVTIRGIDGRRFLKKQDKILGPDSVKYFDEKDKVSTNALSTYDSARGPGETINLAEVGIYKNDDWEYEKEWRFRLPFEVMFSPPEGIKASEFCKLIEFEDNYVDIPLKNNVIDGFEVMLGPLCQKSHEIIVRSLLEKYATNYRLYKSEIQIK